MGLLDTNQSAGLLGGKPSKGGVFGSGYDGEDITSMLLRAAAIANGDYESGAQFGANIGARAKQRAQQAQLDAALSQANLSPEQAALARLYPEKAAEILLKAPAELPADVRSSEWRRTATPEQRAAYDDLHAQMIAMTDGGALARARPGAAPEVVVAPNPGDQALGAPVTSGSVTPFHDPATGNTYYRAGGRVFDNEAEARAAGGGVSNGTGGFPPRKRP